MSEEMRRLQIAYEVDQGLAGDVTPDVILDGVVDEGRSAEFIARISQDPPRQQARFLAELVKYRTSTCLPRLLELIEDKDETAQIWAALGLLYTEQYGKGEEVIRKRISERIKNRHLDKGEWPLFDLFSSFEEAGGERAVPAIIELVERALNTLGKEDAAFRGLKRMQGRYVERSDVDAQE